jgi:aspartyl-tRNA(Asn)/glutamyl-tRNA(Gln) amidotransferase subunit B
MVDFGLSAYDAGVLVAERANADFYEEVAKGRDAKLAANWVITNFFGALNASCKGLEEAPVTAAQLGGLLDLLADDTISGRIAKDVFEEMWESGKDAAVIVEEKGLKQITDTGAIEAAIAKVIANNPGQVEQYTSGANPKVIGWFVGQVMKATQGKANPGMVNQLLKKHLDG